MWDEDTRTGLPLRVVLLGSAPLLVEQGLSESLAGRFEVIPVPHWSLAETRAAFGITLDEYIYFGGYPGAAPLIGDEARWRRYVLDSLVETTISRDVLLLTRVDKPALLRRLFEVGCRYSGQELSYLPTGRRSTPGLAGRGSRGTQEALRTQRSQGGHRGVHATVAGRIADGYRCEVAGAPTPLLARRKPDRRVRLRNVVRSGRGDSVEGERVSNDDIDHQRRTGVDRLTVRARACRWERRGRRRAAGRHSPSR